MKKKVKVRMIIPICGTAEPRYDQPDFSYSAGQIVKLDSRLAEIWINTGKAQKVDKSEAAVLVGEETAMQQRARGRRGVVFEWIRQNVKSWNLE